tara:strand:- start:1936 stop:2490 length:555 start_codon:yes stop_codon:yes gene_type:complete
MKQPLLETKISLTEGVEASMDASVLVVKGPKGEVKRDFFSPTIKLLVKDGEIIVSAINATKREKKLLNTFVAHVKNMQNGVLEGVVYELKICAGHFPMTVTVKDNTLVVKNFIGEAVNRVLKIRDGVSVKVDGEQIIVEGVEKELVGQTAADIELLCRRPGFDKRIFQDGIYIITKNGKDLRIG